jgi:hypothetical protein
MKGMIHLMEKHEEVSLEEASNNLLASFVARKTRRSLIKGAVAGATGLAVVGATALPASAMQVGKGVQRSLAENLLGTRAKTLSARDQDTITSIFTVARTAEQLAVTFYTNGVNNASQLGISGANLENIKAALVEEQIHQLFFTANGGQSLATTFSFPHGSQTFSDLGTFVATLMALEGVFDSAFLAAIKEFADMGRSDLAQIAGQIATVESAHLAIGRQIGGMVPADNLAFTPVEIATVGDAPTVVQQAGFLSPTSGNSYTYSQVSTSDAGVTQTKPFAVSSSMVGNG